mmetsp:Transcript_17816/g.46514  ORF Transcript_17816/g.46514 Transcript_17816/m.46514 type:complete len:492 (+) Transcript_17816:1355-2830(+)
MQPEEPARFFRGIAEVDGEHAVDQVILLPGMLKSCRRVRAFGPKSSRDAPNDDARHLDGSQHNLLRHRLTQTRRHVVGLNPHPPSLECEVVLNPLNLLLSENLILWCKRPSVQQHHRTLGRRHSALVLQHCNILIKRHRCPRAHAFRWLNRGATAPTHVPCRVRPGRRGWFGWRRFVAQFRHRISKGDAQSSRIPANRILALKIRYQPFDVCKRHFRIDEDLMISRHPDTEVEDLIGVADRDGVRPSARHRFTDQECGVDAGPQNVFCFCATHRSREKVFSPSPVTSGCSPLPFSYGRRKHLLGWHLPRGRDNFVDARRDWLAFQFELGFGHSHREADDDQELADLVCRLRFQSPRGLEELFAPGHCRGVVLWGWDVADGEDGVENPGLVENDRGPRGTLVLPRRELIRRNEALDLHRQGFDHHIAVKLVNLARHICCADPAADRCVCGSQLRSCGALTWQSLPADEETPRAREGSLMADRVLVGSSRGPR